MTFSLLTFYPVLFLVIPIGFLLGSVPFGIIFTRQKGVDLRRTGSGNIGATNVLRTAGKLPAVMTLLSDALKGAVPVLLCNYLLSRADLSMDLLRNAKDLWGGIAGTAAVAGHIFSVFLSFKGGKGVATGFGVLLAYSPAAALITLLLWIGVALITRYSSLAAVAAVSALPLTFAIVDFSETRIFFGILLAVMIIYRHKENMQRLIRGEESRIGKKRESQE